MRASDVVPATLMLALCAAIAFDTRRLSFWDETTPGPAFLPVWLAIAGAVLFLLRLAEARRARGASTMARRRRVGAHCEDFWRHRGRAAPCAVARPDPSAR